MLRIAFGRKNKTLAAEFKNKKILQILEKNYRTHCSITNKPIPMEWDGLGDVIQEALDDVTMSDKRARQMDIDDFMRLLESFNKRGIHFARKTCTSLYSV
jgi:18S rRNA (adenine1779-N6/adenine1780-N6)-dimethyltransferase